MAIIVKPPNSINACKPSVFLAGSIEMGRAENWQILLESALMDLDILIFNPRRDDWNSNWKQTIDNFYFREQVEWELNRLEEASAIAMYFDPDTKSPISLLELGIFSKSSKMIVFCPQGFWRKGNIDIVCQRYGIKQVDSFEALIAATKNKLMQYL
jgi:Nucleoside 2-deoxyribosyltransferase like